MVRPTSILLLLQLTATTQAFFRPSSSLINIMLETTTCASYYKYSNCIITKRASSSLLSSPSTATPASTQSTQKRPQTTKATSSKPIAPNTTTTNQYPNPFPLIDVDCNLLSTTLQSLGPNPASLLSHPSFKTSNVVALISPSSSLEEVSESLKVIDELKRSNEGTLVKTTFGIHPYQATINSPGELGEYLHLLNEVGGDGASQERKNSNIAAIGECGLDYSPGFPERSIQLQAFIPQIELALERGMPIFVHERLAFDDVKKLIEERLLTTAASTTSLVVPVIIHCFTGTYEEAEWYLSAGCHLSFSGYILKPSEGSTNRLLLKNKATTLLSKLMIETDAPYMGFPGCRDHYLSFNSSEEVPLNSKKLSKAKKQTSPNVPSSLPLVLKGVWEAINDGKVEGEEGWVSIEEVAKITRQNSERFFGL
jgi:TatD DNase family protein